MQKLSAKNKKQIIQTMPFHTLHFYFHPLHADGTRSGRQYRAAFERVVRRNPRYRALRALKFFPLKLNDRTRVIPQKHNFFLLTPFADYVRVDNRAQAENYHVQLSGTPRASH